MHRTYLPLAPFAVPITVSIILALAARSRHRRLGDQDIYELPMSLAYLVAIFGVLFLAVPFIPGIGGGKPVELYFYAFFAAFSAGAFGAALWFMRYRVTVGTTTVAVRFLLRERVIPFTEIINSDLLAGRQARELVIYLRGGHRLRLSGLLQDFDDLVDKLNEARVSQTDSAEKIADQQRSAAGRRGANWIMIVGIGLVAIALIASWVAER